jgi:AraC-like DNA-binding protein
MRGMSVASVCTAVGFEELSSFSKLFKRLAGTNPSVFQRRQLALQKQIAEAPLTLVPHCFAHQYGWVGKKEQFQTNEV